MKNSSSNVLKGSEFLKENKGALKISRTESGAYHIAFTSPATGRTSFAYGKNFKQAYGKMVINFTLKYSA